MKRRKLYSQLGNAMLATLLASLICLALCVSAAPNSFHMVHQNRQYQHHQNRQHQPRLEGGGLTGQDESDSRETGESGSSLMSGGDEMGEPGESMVETTEHDEATEDSQEAPERNLFIVRHNSQLQAMQDLFERRQLGQQVNQAGQSSQLPASQELSPISIGLDPTGPGGHFGMAPFAVPNHAEQHVKPPLANVDNLDQALGGPALPFGLSPLPHLLGFQGPQFDGPQHGDQSAHSNHHAPMAQNGAVNAQADQDGVANPSQKVWPKIFRFTDGRINLSEFEKQKKIKLSNKNQHNTDNHIESAPIMFDGRQLKRKSFLILHGGIFSR